MSAVVSAGAETVLEVFGEVPVLASLPVIDQVVDTLPDDLGLVVTTLVHVLAVTAAEVSRELEVSYHDAKVALLAMLATSIDAYEQILVGQHNGTMSLGGR